MCKYKIHGIYAVLSVKAASHVSQRDFPKAFMLRALKWCFNKNG